MCFIRVHICHNTFLHRLHLYIRICGAKGGRVNMFVYLCNLYFCICVFVLLVFLYLVICVTCIFVFVYLFKLHLYMWNCSGGRASDHQRTIRPKWGQLPGQVVQILCSGPQDTHNTNTQIQRYKYTITKVQKYNKFLDPQRTARPSWGQLTGQMIQILCSRPQYTDNTQFCCCCCHCY